MISDLHNKCNGIYHIKFEKINQLLEIKIDNIRNAMFSTTSVQKVILLDVMKFVHRQSLFACTIHRKYLFMQSSSSAVREPQRRWL